MMKIIQRLWTAAGLPCRTCSGKGYVVDSGINAFIRQNGLALYQAADTLMRNEIVYGALGSIPVSSWEDIGLSEDQAMVFITEVSCGHALHSCPACAAQPNHDDALGAATKIINDLIADNRRRHDEWEARNCQPGE